MLAHFYEFRVLHNGSSLVNEPDVGVLCFVVWLCWKSLSMADILFGRLPTVGVYPGNLGAHRAV